MKTPFNLFKSLVSFVLIVSSIGLTSCNKNETPPDLPPVGSFVMDFDDFNNISKAAGDSTKFNAAVSVLAVGIWNIVLTATMAVPVAAFREAFNHEGEWDKKKEGYVWAYTVPIGAATYSLELVGYVDDESSTTWEMYISLGGGFQDVLWYEGVVATNGTSATWTLNKDGNNPESFLKIVYSKTDAENTSIRYTNVEDSDNNGSYIDFSTYSGDDHYDRQYDIYGAPENKLVEIVWNNKDKQGYFTSPTVSNGDKKCWNGFLEDDVCL